MQVLDASGTPIASFEITRPSDLGKPDGVEVPFWRLQHKPDDKDVTMTMSHIDVPIPCPKMSTTLSPKLKITC